MFKVKLLLFYDFRHAGFRQLSCTSHDIQSGIANIKILTVNQESLLQMWHMHQLQDGYFILRIGISYHEGAYSGLGFAF